MLVFVFSKKEDAEHRVLLCYVRPSDQHTDVDKNGVHGEIRTCSVIRNLKMIENLDRWTGLKSIIQLESTRIVANAQAK